MIKIKTLVCVDEPDRPKDVYSIELTFSIKNQRDIEDYFLFKKLDQLSESIELLQEYFEVNHNTRCNATLFEVVSDKRKQDLLELNNLNYGNYSEYQLFCSFLDDEWPRDEGYGIPSMLDSFEVYYYDTNSAKFKVLFE